MRPAVLVLLFLSLHAASGATYVGSVVCKTCHPAIVAGFAGNPHAQSLTISTLAPADTGCEGCHGPASDHIRRPSKTTINAFSTMPPQQALTTCLRCHAQSVTRANIHRSPHTRNGVGCTSCHGIHSAATPRFLLAQAQPTLCYGCHQEVRAQFNLPFKHRVNEGAMSCTDCHNPHGAPAPTWRTGTRPRLQQPVLGAEQSCVGCHAQYRGPFVFEHAAVRVDGCESCHAPHGSPNARLLKRPVVLTLCLECHNGAGRFGRQSNGVAVPPGFHNLADPRYHQCTACHVRIHGSNANAQFLH